MVWRELTSRFFEDRTRPRTTVRPSVRIRDLDRVLRYVVRMCRRQVPHRQASTPHPPHVMFLTRPSRRLAISIACYVARAGKAWERGYVYIMCNSVLTTCVSALRCMLICLNYVQLLIFVNLLFTPYLPMADSKIDQIWLIAK